MDDGNYWNSGLSVTVFDWISFRTSTLNTYVYVVGTLAWWYLHTNE